jgi:hypothetical protein
MKAISTSALALGLVLALGAGCDEDSAGPPDATVAPVGDGGTPDAVVGPAPSPADGGAGADVGAPSAAAALGADLLPSTTGLEADLFPPLGSAFPADLLPPP